ncbi:MAG: ParB/RepB/Spo0J family partition protein [Pseudomonadota bacterium]
MPTKRKGLGRGLDALLSQSARPATKPAEPAQPSQADAGPDKSSDRGDGQLRQLAVDLLERGEYQPRVDMRTETLEDLADSIRAQGMVQPIIVRPVGVGATQRYEIVAGERRWRAAQIAGLDTVPAVVRDIPDAAAMAMALIENIQRENLNPLEEAGALQRLMNEFDMTHAQAAEAVGRSRASVSNLVRLLDLDPPVKKLLEERKLDMGHARALLALGSRDQQDAARQVVAKGLSVRETEKLVKRMLTAKPAKPAASRDPDIQRLEDQLSETLGARVAIAHGNAGKGKLTIPYNSLDELEGILSHIK